MADPPPQSPESKPHRERASTASKSKSFESSSEDDPTCVNLSGFGCLFTSSAVTSSASSKPSKNSVFYASTPALTSTPLIPDETTVSSHDISHKSDRRSESPKFGRRIRSGIEKLKQHHRKHSKEHIDPETPSPDVPKFADKLWPKSRTSKVHSGEVTPETDSSEQSQTPSPQRQFLTSSPTFSPKRQSNFHSGEQRPEIKAGAQVQRSPQISGIHRSPNISARPLKAYSSPRYGPNNWSAEFLAGDSNSKIESGGHIGSPKTGKRPITTGYKPSSTQQPLSFAHHAQVDGGHLYTTDYKEDYLLIFERYSTLLRIRYRPTSTYSTHLP